jgi:hypothetical protein
MSISGLLFSPDDYVSLLLQLPPNQWRIAGLIQGRACLRSCSFPSAWDFPGLGDGPGAR